MKGGSADRGRIPFALIGVLLLVASGAVTVSQHDPAVTEPPVDRSMDRLTAETQSALRAAVHDAARDAARRPVLRAANTTAGSALNETGTFRDALGLRIYLKARANLERLSTQRRGVDRTASLPPVVVDDGDPEADGTGTGVRRAIERVTLSPAGPDDRQLRVQIDGLELRASRGSGLGGESHYAPTFVVDTPVLAVHDRVTRFESRLGSDVGQPGLASRVSAVLYPVAWARGYAQYRSQPIENVVANRHVALATNGAVLAEQRRVFGASDPVGRSVYLRELADVGLTDFTGAANSTALDRLATARQEYNASRTADEPLAVLEPEDGAPGPADTTDVTVGRAADRAALDALEDLNETVAATYAPAVRTRADVRTVAHDIRRRHDPGGGWELDDEHVSYETAVRNRSGSAPASVDGWHPFTGYSKTVAVEKRTVRHWDKPDNTTGRTERIENFTRKVDLVVEGDHVVGPAPDGLVASVHEPGGPLDGPNLADAGERIRTHVERERGGADHLAAMAATDRLDTDPRSVQAARPEGIAAWASADLPGLRREVRSTSVTVSLGEVASFRRNVPELLADRLRDRRVALVDGPATYGSVAERARVGVRADFVDRVIARLEHRADQHDAAGETLDEALPSSDEPATDLLADGYAPEHTADEGHSDAGAKLAVDATPSYLPTEAVDHETVPGIPANRTEHPLAVRNVNAVSVPTSGVVDGLLGLLSGPEKASLRTATQVLRTVETSAQDALASNPVVEGLDEQVASNVDHVRESLRDALQARGLGSETSRESVVESAISRWGGTAARSEAIVNGSAAAAVHDAAAERWSEELRNATARDRLAVALDLAAVEARKDDDPRPHLAAVNATTSAVRMELEARLERVADEATERVGKRVEQRVQKRVAAVAARLPSGVPLVPAPGMWYATVNAWHVEMRGSYARFAVRSPRGSPDRLPPSLTYLRENRTVSLDVDADGDAERLGRNRRITFDAETVIGVAVPPGAQGVGDADARDERSPGWPEPGPVENETREK